MLLCIFLFWQYFHYALQTINLNAVDLNIDNSFWLCIENFVMHCWFDDLVMHCWYVDLVMHWWSNYNFVMHCWFGDELLIWWWYDLNVPNEKIKLRWCNRHIRKRNILKNPVIRKIFWCCIDDLVMICSWCF